MVVVVVTGSTRTVELATGVAGCRVASCLYSAASILTALLQPANAKHANATKSSTRGSRFMCALQKAWRGCYATPEQVVQGITS